MSNEINCNDPIAIITQVLDDMQKEQDKEFDIEKVNLAELERRTGISRSKLRTLKSKGFKTAAHGLEARKAATTVLSGFTGAIDSLLGGWVTNSADIYEQLTNIGYTGGITTVKNYIAAHKDLLPAKRKLVAEQGSRGQRYETNPGAVQQIDWGFINVSINNQVGLEFRAACFAQICHHCEAFYVKFFPNARQENLFIGMTHGFLRLGIPKYILTDNIKSIVIRRDINEKPVWQHDYEAYMKTVNFETKLCKPRHPFTKGKVERLVRFVKDNFLSGRYFWNYTDLNEAAHAWCSRQNNKYHKANDCIPNGLHQTKCCSVCHPFSVNSNSAEDVIKGETIFNQIEQCAQTLNVELSAQERKVTEEYIIPCTDFWDTDKLFKTIDNPGESLEPPKDESYFRQIYKKDCRGILTNELLNQGYRIRYLDEEGWIQMDFFYYLGGKQSRPTS